jgi:hypothetical protein
MQCPDVASYIDALYFTVTRLTSPRRTRGTLLHLDDY